MTQMRNLLVEIGTEELPPKALKRLSEAFSEGIRTGLDKAQLVYGEIRRYATPRRLAVLVHGLHVRQTDREVERRGPALTAAFDDEGLPTTAAQGFARSCGATLEQLETLETDKGAWLVFRSVEEGRPTAELIPAIVQESLDKLPIPKRMRWGDLNAEFVRPVHWVVLLFGSEIIETELLSIRSGRETRGHRFHHPEPLYLAEADAYAPLLETEGRVIADFADRREAIRAQVLEAGAALGGQVVLDDDLLDEVTGLVEWPVAVVGNFDTRFLEVPSEALVSAMKRHQKYFHVVDAQSKLLPYFIAVSNIESRQPDVVRAGNERVIRPRLSDADFFWGQDRRMPLGERLESLKSVVFQEKLGTLYDKSNRVAELAKEIAQALGGEAQRAKQAALLSKCDLMTAMVAEFPELQGVMGCYYARHDGHDEETARAIDEQYMPRFAGDRLAKTTTGQALAIADRLDTLVGIFAIGQPPSGDKDPFGLRRAALGILRTMVERSLDLDLEQLLRQADKQMRLAPSGDTVGQVFDFMMERLRGYYHEAGVAPDIFEAVLARRPTSPRDFDERIRAVDAFRSLPEAESLAAANKRIHNILRQADTVPETFDPAALAEPQEKTLAAAVVRLGEEVGPLFARREYEQALKMLAGLKGPVDAFFDSVLVMAQDPKVRSNRLGLLKQLGDLFLQVADISRLQG